MAKTEFEYDVTSSVSLEDDLASATIEGGHVCHHVSKSYVTRDDTGAEVDFITADWTTQRFSVLTLDATEELRDKTIGFTWKIDLTDGQQKVELASFSITFIAPSSDFFDSPLTSVIQIYRQPTEFAWTYVLPALVSPIASISVDFGTASFLSYNDALSQFEIPNLADPDLVSGTFTVQVTVSEGQRVVTHEVKVHLYDPPQILDNESSQNITESIDQTSTENGNTTATATAASSSSDSESTSSGDSVVAAANTTISEEDKVVS